MGKQVTEPCGNNKGHNPTGQSLENDKRNYGTFQNLLSTFTVLISSHTYASSFAVLLYQQSVYWFMITKP